MSTATTPVTTTSNGYRYDHPRMFPDIVNDMIMSKKDLGPGDRVQPFDLPTTDGGRLRSSDVAAKGQPVLLVFGSRTCPVTESAGDGLKELYARYGKRVRFVMITVREAHPGEDLRQPQTFAEKVEHAKILKDHHNFPFEVAIDDVDGSFHRTLGSRPNSVYVIDPAGTILFRAQWGNETAAIDEALSAIVAGQTPRHPSVTRTMHSITQMIGYMNPVLDAAGKGARLDTWKVVPPMGIMMSLSELFFFLPRHKRGLPAMILTMALMMAVIVGIILLVGRFVA